VLFTIALSLWDILSLEEVKYGHKVPIVLNGIVATKYGSRETLTFVGGYGRWYYYRGGYLGTMLPGALS
jgi:hypothetical protein